MRLSKIRFLCFLFSVFVIFTGSLSARGAGENRRNILTIYGIKGSSGLGIIRMFENPPQAEGFDIRLEALAQADLVAARFISGEALVGILPPNIAAKIASSLGNIQVAAVTGNGMLNLLSSDPDIGSIEDLRGKRVEIAGAGATPEYVFKRILMDRGIDPEKDITLGSNLAYPEIAQALISGRISTALIPEPFATMALRGRSQAGQANESEALPVIRQIGNIQEEWKNRYNSDYPMTVLAVNKKFASGNPSAMTAILQSLEDSIRWIVSNPEEAGELAEKHNMGFPQESAALAIPRSNYIFISAVSARPSLEALFRVFLDFSPQSIGGALPEDDFYYQPKS